MLKLFFGAHDNIHCVLDLDQNPRRIHLFELYQGIANLAPNGPDDGGLVVLKGSHKLNEEYFKACGGWKHEQDAGEDQNGYRMTQADTDWYRARGCEEVKVCAGPGDFIRKCHTESDKRGTRHSKADLDMPSVGFAHDTLERKSGRNANEVRYLHLYVSPESCFERGSGQENGGF